MAKWDLRRELYRKAVHVSLCVLLLVPFYYRIPLTLSAYYGLGLFLTALMNSFAVKRIQLAEDIEAIEEHVKAFRGLFEKHLGEPIKVLEEPIAKLEKFALEQISILERDYERREGYVGLLYGMIGVSTTYLVFPGYIYYGALALLVVDPVASLTGMLTGEGRKPPLHGTLGGFAISSALYATLLYTLMRADPLSATAVAVAASAAELLSVEDNLTIPFAAALTAWLTGMPALTPL